jgi:ABC-2 type transport system ATP-binding protein
MATGGAALTSSTPDALWGAPVLRALRPTAITAIDLSRGPLLDRCNLSVPVGMRLLVVGNPEAGPSMLLRVLAGLSRPSRGRVELAGLQDPSIGGWGSRIAYLGPEPGIHQWMTPREALALTASLLRLTDADAARRMDRAFAWVGIPFSDTTRAVKRGGPRLAQRVGLAAALIADPEVLLLDEPLRALEAEERARLLRLPGRRRTVVLASREPASEAGLASHVALLREGRIAMLAPTSELDAASLPLSMRGILSLAELRSSARAGAFEHPAARGA